MIHAKATSLLQRNIMNFILGSLFSHPRQSIEPSSSIASPEQVKQQNNSISSSTIKHQSSTMARRPPTRRNTPSTAPASAKKATSTAAASKQPNHHHGVNAVTPKVNKKASNTNKKNALDDSDDESEVGSSDVENQVTIKRKVGNRKDRYDDTDSDEDSIENSPKRVRVARETDVDKLTEEIQELENFTEELEDKNEDLRQCVEKLKRQLSRTEDRLAKSERSLQVLRSTHGRARTKKKAPDDPQVKLCKSELRSFMKYNLGRKMKFLPKGCKKWSDRPKSICQTVIKSIHWPPGSSDEEKMDMWERVLAPNLTLMMTEYKNKIHQQMRMAFNGEICFLDLLFV